MKSLFRDPTGHNIKCSSDDISVEDNYAQVSIQLCAESDNLEATGAITREDALAISKWFADLAVEMTPKSKMKK